MEWSKIKELAYKAGFDSFACLYHSDMDGEISATGEYGCGEMMAKFVELVEAELALEWGK